MEAMVPQRLTTVTLGARSVPSLRAFYKEIGWQENDGSDDAYASFTLGAVRVALFPIDNLRREAAPGEDVPTPEWNGTTLSMNVASREEVDEAIRSASAAGGHPIGSAVEREWGGYSGYFADPEGHRWEVAWAPWLTDFS
jgi:predicted lactoylglutathione lyase